MECFQVVLSSQVWACVNKSWFQQRQRMSRAVYDGKVMCTLVAKADW
jgi:hypothetical protein